MTLIWDKQTDDLYHILLNKFDLSFINIIMTRPLGLMFVETNLFTNEFQWLDFLIYILIVRIQYGFKAADFWTSVRQLSCMQTI